MVRGRGPGGRGSGAHESAVESVAGPLTSSAGPALRKSPHLARTMVNGSHLGANSAALPHKAWRPPPRSTLAVRPGYSRPADDVRATPGATAWELACRGCADARGSHPGYCSLRGVRAEAPAAFLARSARAGCAHRVHGPSGR